MVGEELDRLCRARLDGGDNARGVETGREDLVPLDQVKEGVGEEVDMLHTTGVESVIALVLWRWR